MGNDQVELNIRPGLEGIVDSMGLPDAILESAGAIVVLLRRSAFHLELDALDPVALAGGLFRDESAAMPMLLDERSRDVSELGGIVLMNEADMHNSRFPN